MKTSNCASCKYQRQKCGKDCLLAPYFPAERSQDFINVHKLFGVRNIVKYLKKFKDQGSRNDYMASIIYQANVRACYPIEGCSLIVKELNQQIQSLQSELNSVLWQLQYYKCLKDQQLASHDSDLGFSLYDVHVNNRPFQQQPIQNDQQAAPDNQGLYADTFINSLFTGSHQSQ